MEMNVKIDIEENNNVWNIYSERFNCVYVANEVRWWPCIFVNTKTNKYYNGMRYSTDEEGDDTFWINPKCYNHPDFEWVEED